MPHPDPIRMARRVQRLGIVRHLQGDDGIPALEKAIGLFEQLTARVDVETAGVLSETGISSHRAAARREHAQRCLRRALRIHEREHGANSLEAVRDLRQLLAGSHEEAGDIESAASLYERALELKDRIIGGDEEELAEMQLGVAGLYIDWEIIRAPVSVMCIGTFKWKRARALPSPMSCWPTSRSIPAASRDALAELERAGKAWETCGPDSL